MGTESAAAETEQTFSEMWASAQKEAEKMAAGGAGDILESDPEETEETGTETTEESEGTEERDPNESEGSEDDDAGEEEPPSDPKLDARKKKWLEEAKALGFSVPDENLREVAVAERVKFRRKMQEQRASLRAEHQASMVAIEAEKSKASERFAAQEKLRSAMESDDHEAIAQALGHKSWKELNKHYFDKMQDPRSKEIAALRKRDAEREERDKVAAAEKAQQEKAAHREKLMAAHKSDIVESLHDFKSGKYKMFADDPFFIQTIITHQEQSWDGSEMIGIEEAAELAHRDAKKTLDRLLKLFGSGTPSAEQRPAGEAVKGGKKPPKSISKEDSTDAAIVTDEELPDDELIRKFASKFK